MLGTHNRGGVTVTYQEEVSIEFKKIAPETIAAQEARLGLQRYEPLLVAMDAMIRYARAYKKHYEGHLKDDYVLGPQFLRAIMGIRGLLNGQGGVALEMGISTDSKDNGMIEGLFWRAVEIGGFEEGKDF